MFWAWLESRGTEIYACMTPEPATRQARGIIMVDVPPRIKRSTRFGTVTSVFNVRIIIISITFYCQIIRVCLLILTIFLFTCYAMDNLNEYL